MTTDAGSIKLVSLNGQITIEDGDADGFGVSAATTGDVLLWARQDVVVNSDILSGSGHRDTASGDDIDLNADVITMVAAFTSPRRTTQWKRSACVDMQGGTFIRTSGGNVRVLADNEGDILLSQIDAGTGDVSLWLKVRS